MKEMVCLSELLGNRSNCTKRHKRTALAYITDELLHKCVDFCTSSTGQVRIILIAHLYNLLFSI